MQLRFLLVLVYFAVPAAKSSKYLRPSSVEFTQETSSSDSTQSVAIEQAAESTAALWLRSHAGTPDELAELKQVNPNAYAIVQALLTKRSLGLLDSKHPTASFANEDGSPVSRAQLALAAKKSTVTYAASQPTTHHDWFNWKGGAMDDEAMVQNMLGEDTVQEVVGRVAELRGKRAALGFIQETLSSASSKYLRPSSVGFAQESSSSDSTQSMAIEQAAEFTATLWLRSHAGTPDELAELKQVNPNAYAIVKALLTKRSLGLLDSKHPTVSFANEDGSPVSRAQLALAAKKSTVTYAASQPTTHHDWFNWKGGAMDDEAMVQNMLGEDTVQEVVGRVAELKGKRTVLGFTQESTSSGSAQSAARLWLDSHRGSPDELTELKSANPQAYEIVKILLEKRAQQIQQADNAKTIALLTSKRHLLDKKIKEAQSTNPKLMQWISGADKASAAPTNHAPTGQAKASVKSNPYLLDLKD